MAIRIDQQITVTDLVPDLLRVFALSGTKIVELERTWDPSKGTPVFTTAGKYISRGWTEWTQGFQFGSALLQFDATGEDKFIELGRRKTVELMAPHVSHMGVHDHGFNNISTYGNLWRLMREGKIPHNTKENEFYELALKVSGAIQAARWTTIPEGGYIYSFNGPHSLFVDTMRSLRSLAVAHQLGHCLMGERDRKISLLQRLVQHAEATSRYNVYYGEERDAYDVCGRTAHESIFNVNDGSYRCPNAQQGYSAFTTWTRGLAWAMLGFAEQLEFLRTIPEQSLEELSGSLRTGKEIRSLLVRAAKACADYYLATCFRDGIPVWDTGAPNLHRMGDYGDSDPYNDWEPVDSSAAAIAAQGLVRLGNYLKGVGLRKAGVQYCQAGFTVTRTLIREPYLSFNPKHQGLLLHSVYHRPSGWDHTPKGQKVPNGESSMWGDYHLRELALLLLREARGENYLTFFKH